MFNIGRKIITKNSQTPVNQIEVIVFKTVRGIQNYLIEQKAKGFSIGFVPTMGALHQGHIALMAKSIKETDITVCSIFVNPTQFNNISDLEKYPKAVDSDMKLLIEVGCHVLFLPSVAEMYPDGPIINTEDYGLVTQVLEGEKRPGHFDGVKTIVAKLFDAISPNKTFFGQKDYQQAMVVAELIKRHYPHIQLFIEPTVRHTDGLAMSSRNMRLTKTQREEATIISKSLLYIQENWGSNTIELLVQQALQMMATSKSLRIEYFNVYHSKTLELLSGDSALQAHAVVLVAAFSGEVRLIDNWVINPSLAKV